MKRHRNRGRQAGYLMMEVLITMFVLVIGLLGLAGLQARAHQAETESYQRVQALVLLRDMADRINANRARPRAI
jgi:type IV pilus assembly protein PilV